MKEFVERFPCISGAVLIVLSSWCFGTGIREVVLGHFTTAVPLFAAAFVLAVTEARFSASDG